VDAQNALADALESLLRAMQLFPPDGSDARLVLEDGAAEYSD